MSEMEDSMHTNPKSRSKPSSLSLLIAMTVFAALATSSIALGQTWTSVDYPGALQTYLYGGPNPEGASIGSWQDSGLAWHGFIYQNGKFKSFDAPGSPACNAGASGLYGTDPAWITPQGEIVGAYYDPSCVGHGFTLKDDQYTTIDFPGAAYTIFNGMNPSGELAGEYCVDPACSIFHSFTLSKKGQFTSFDPPGALLSWAGPINPSGAIVGYYCTTSTPTPTTCHGYLLYHGNFTKIDFPGGFYTYSGAINPKGDIIGGYNDSKGVSHGYLLSKGVFKSLEFPGAAWTAAAGINPSGIIVGSYGDAAGNQHGFVWTP
jgi:uncharacterized membrane protein